VKLRRRSGGGGGLSRQSPGLGRGFPSGREEGGGELGLGRIFEIRVQTTFHFPNKKTHVFHNFPEGGVKPSLKKKIYFETFGKKNAAGIKKSKI